MAIISQQERQILEMVSDGFTDKEIAISLGRATQTVKNQQAAIRHKLGAKNRAHAVNIIFGQTDK